MIVDQHDDQLDPFLDGGDDLAAHHQIRSVADHGEHLAIGGRHLHPQRTRDFITHARVAVLDVVLLGIAGPPQFVQVARHRARGGHDNIARAGRIVDRTDDLALRGQGPMSQVVQAVDLAVPVLVQAGGQIAVRGVHRVAAQPRAQGRDAGASIADQRQAAVLVGVEVQHVEVDEMQVRVGEHGMRGGGEVGPARADPDHDIGLARQAVCGQRAGCAHGAQIRRMIEGQ